MIDEEKIEWNFEDGISLDEALGISEIDNLQSVAFLTEMGKEQADSKGNIRISEMLKAVLENTELNDASKLKAVGILWTSHSMLKEKVI